MCLRGAWNATRPYAEWLCEKNGGILTALPWMLRGIIVWIMTEPLIADNLSTLSLIRHAFFTREYGNGGFYIQENPPEVRNGRERMAGWLDVTPQNLISGYQVHSPDVVTVTEIWDADHRPKVDALVTDKKGIALGVLTADCVPVLFAYEGKADQPSVIGAAHAGWRGAIGGVLENTVKAMERLGATNRKIFAALGPCIGQRSYEVGPEFPAPFVAENLENQRFFKPAFKSDHYMFDLPGYVVAKLHGLGLVDVEGPPADTCADPERFYSHRYCTLRHEKRTGNLMSAIVII